VAATWKHLNCASFISDPINDILFRHGVRTSFKAKKILLGQQLYDVRLFRQPLPRDVRMSLSWQAQGSGRNLIELDHNVFDFAALMAPVRCTAPMAAWRSAISTVRCSRSAA
jgi:hypothetical protein